MNRYSLRWALIPLLPFLIIAPWSAQIDRAATGYFYVDGSFSDNAFFQFMYDWGPSFPFVLAITGCVALLVSFVTKKWKIPNRPLLVFILTYALGGGLLTEAVFKEYWGRPRPRQCVEFGGKQDFRPWYRPNFFDKPEPSRSFVCGHCTAGFVFLALAVIGRRQRRRELTVAGWLLGLGLGITLGITRIAQGGHFVTDVYAAALLMWWTALTVDWLLYDD